MKFASLTILFALSTAVLFAQTDKKREDPMPKVFVIGEFETQYEALVQNYEHSLLDVCGADLKRAYDLWSSLTREMEAYSTQAGFDLNGVKAWFHVFFQPNGKIDYIGFYLKPNSKNVDTTAMQEFLTAFAGQYQFPLTSPHAYYNYTSVHFPTAYNLYPSDEDERD